MSTSPRASTHTKCVSRPPPPACSAEPSPHSAHSVTPYDAFSTLQPTTTRPSSTRAAAPTGNSEYGAYARCMTAVAAPRSASQSISTSALHVGHTGRGGAAHAADETGHGEDRQQVREHLQEL